jgi:hypothetical protein
MGMKDSDEVAAMRSDIKLLLSTVATKDDFRKLALEIVKTNGRIDQQGERVEASLRGMSSSFHKKVDAFMSEVGKVDRAQIIADWRIAQLEKRVGDVESRPS